MQLLRRRTWTQAGQQGRLLEGTDWLTCEPARWVVSRHSSTGSTVPKAPRAEWSWWLQGSFCGHFSLISTSQLQLMLKQHRSRTSAACQTYSMLGAHLRRPAHNPISCAPHVAALQNPAQVGAAHLGNPQLFPQAWRPAALQPAVPPALQRSMSQELPCHRACGYSSLWDAHIWVQRAAGASCLM